MGNHQTRDMDLTFFRNVFSMMAYGEPDNFYDQISAIAREQSARRIEIGFGPISAGYSPIGTLEIGPFTAGAILQANRTSGLLEQVYSKLVENEGNGIWKYLQNSEPPTSIRVDMTHNGIFPFGIELKIEKYLDVSKNYKEANPTSDSLDDLRLEREAVMIWHYADHTNGGVLIPLKDHRIKIINL